MHGGTFRNVWPRAAVHMDMSLACSWKAPGKPAWQQQAGSTACLYGTETRHVITCKPAEAAGLVQQTNIVGYGSSDCWTSMAWAFFGMQLCHRAPDDC